MSPAPARPRRIAILGAQGAGKSHLAVILGRTLDLPVVHLDVEFYRAWHDLDRNPAGVEVRELLDRLAAGDGWIIDGNHGCHDGGWRSRLERSDVVILLDTNPWLCAWRILVRRLRIVGRAPDPLPPHLWLSLAALRAPFHTRARLHADRELRALPIVRLRSQRAVAHWIRSVGAGCE